MNERKLDKIPTTTKETNKIIRKYLGEIIQQSGRDIETIKK